MVAQNSCSHYYENYGEAVLHALPTPTSVRILFSEILTCPASYSVFLIVTISRQYK